MHRTHRRRTVLAAVPLAALGALSVAAPAGAAPAAGPVAAPVPGAQVPLLAGPDGPTTSVVAAEVDGPALRAARTATIRVTYHGFSPAAKASFQRAVDIWATQVSSRVPITVDATYRPLGAGVLGSAGPDLLWRNFPGAPQRDTLYPDALANKLAGKQLSSRPDIVANFSSSFSNWNFAAGPAPRGKYDFESVVLHELGHGLGFLGAGRVAGGQGTVRFSGAPVVYDRFVTNAAGTKLITLPDPSAALRQQITGGALFFRSGALKAKLYAPRTFQGGSSYSHLDEATYRAGSPNSLMTPQLGAGETIHSEGPLTKGILRAIGW